MLTEFAIPKDSVMFGLQHIKIIWPHTSSFLVLPLPILENLDNEKNLRREVIARTMM